MAEEVEEAQVLEEEPIGEESLKQIVEEPTEETEPTPETDWKAEARKWQRRAKENKEKADKLEKTETELEKTQSRLTHANLVNSVSQETGVPATLLHGETKEELAVSAEAILSFASTKAPGYPADKGGSATPPPVSSDSIEKIQDPVQRVRTRAAHIDLYNK